jgi:hypothetical protein
MHQSIKSIILIAILAFLGGIYYCITVIPSKEIENLQNMNKPRCPNILVQKNKRFYLYNSKLEKVPGVNPIEFEHLEDYVEFMEWQRGQGIRCPVLFLQHTYDVQGKSTYKIRPGPSDLQGGLPPCLVNNPVNPPKQKLGPDKTLLVDASRNDAPYNKNSMPGFDKTDYYQGTRTPLDNVGEEDEHMLYSPNPMDDNWGGQAYTQKLVDSGYYADNEVRMRR